MSEPGKPAIRSFVRREGRITRAQSRALEEDWCRYGLEYAESPLDFATIYGNNAPTIAEIGFGNGGALASMAANWPDHNFLGIEVYRPGVGSLLLKLRQRGLSNVRIIMDDAAIVVRDSIRRNSLLKLLVFFPDPWPKKRHHKRRLLRQPFLETAIERLQIGGQFHVATDWEEYAHEVLELFRGEPRLRNSSDSDGFVTRPDYRPMTKYEQRGMKLGHKVWDLVFERIS